jgi:hypothetical protein
MKKVLIVLVTISLIIYGTGCRKQSPKNIVAAVDLSVSRDSTVFEWYIDQINAAIIQHLDTKSALQVVPIDAKSKTVEEELFAVDFARNIYGNELSGFQQEEIIEKSHSDSIAATAPRLSTALRAAKMERAAYAQRTDIIGALQRLPKQYREGYDNVLVIFSDMICHTDQVDFHKELRSEQDIKSVLAKIDTVDLSNWEVVIVTGGHSNISIERYSLLEKFWAAYIAKCRGHLVDYASRSTETLVQTIQKHR